MRLVQGWWFQQIGSTMTQFDASTTAITKWAKARSAISCWTPKEWIWRQQGICWKTSPRRQLCYLSRKSSTSKMKNRSLIQKCLKSHQTPRSKSLSMKMINIRNTIRWSKDRLRASHRRPNRTSRRTRAMMSHQALEDLGWNHPKAED